MILELGDGRELQLPDECSDEFARALKRLILTCEERARTAEQQCTALQAEVAHLRAEIQALAARPSPAPQVIVDNTALLAVLKAINAGVHADRVMMADESGEYTRSRIAK